MGPTRGSNPEDELFARRAGERERDRSDAEAITKRSVVVEPVAVEGETKGRASRIVAAVSTAMKALFGIRGNRRSRHA